MAAVVFKSLCREPASSRLFFVRNHPQRMNSSQQLIVVWNALRVVSIRWVVGHGALGKQELLKALVHFCFFRFALPRLRTDHLHENVVTTVF